MADACGFDDGMRLGWDADIIRSAGPDGPIRCRLWLLFDDAPFAFVFRGLASAG